MGGGRKKNMIKILREKRIISETSCLKDRKKNYFIQLPWYQWYRNLLLGVS